MDPRVAVSVSDLIMTKQWSHAFSLPSSNKVASRLAGSHPSSLRGRGLDFEEYRHYQAGDDVRNIDWLVTMKTNQPHVRVHQQEKDRAVLFCVEQGTSMFFSSQQTMKSVVAAQLLAACSWQVLRQGDRIGAVVVDDESLHWFKPSQSQNALLRLFRTLESLHLNLVSNACRRHSLQGKPNLNRALNRMLLQRTQGSLVVVISDFFDFDDNSSRLMTQLKRHNDVVCLAVQDPMEQALIVNDTSYFSDGDYQVMVDSTYQTKLEAFNATRQAHQDNIKQQLQSKGIRYIQLDTSGHHFYQLTEQLSGCDHVKK
ncbi:DUF58 domain-containing protein [Vibrio sp. ZSDZ65]|uniref:DUF58 domain-containing protein n=1 Tax=Vibrio qingdaonensis TaxID=2829491 RepID=A0A9X3CMZ5_9VIBR|nr:DUF58 domain-containing protein [Vibrio qingdaonensis]MCW8346361.1 DUF58 domain-containing protein [Vibrio qingdaonensis]